MESGRQEDQQRRIRLAERAAGRTGHVVQAALLDELQQIRAFGGVHDQPDFGLERLLAVGTGEIGSLGIRIGNSISLSDGSEK